MINFLQKKALKKALSQKGRKAEYCRLSSLKSVAVVMDISTDSSNTEAKAIFDKFFEGVSMTFSSPVFRLLRHPFSWVFTNSVLWAPVFTAGVQYRLGNEWNMIVGFAPLAFQDTHFVYEFFSPFAIYSIEADEWGWGCYILRFSYFF